MRQHISRLAVGLLLALFASQSMALSTDGKRGYRQFLADQFGSDTVALAMDDIGGGVWIARPVRNHAEQDALYYCKKRSKRPKTCKIVDVDGQSAWWRGGAKGNPVSSSTSSSSASMAGYVWCGSEREVSFTTSGLCQSQKGKGFSNKRLAEDYHRNSSSSIASSLSSNSGPYVWCGSEGGVSFMPSGSCQSLKGKGFVNKHLAENYWRSQTRPQLGPYVWCGSEGGVSFMPSGSCQSLKGKGFVNKHLAEDYRLKLTYSPAQIVSTASLTIRSNVRGDRVYIDGKYKGSTRLDLDLPKGRHTIRIEKDGYKTYEEEIDLKNALTLRASLEKIAAQPVQTVSTDNTSVEVSFWESIRGSNDPDMYRAYLESFPKGKFAPLAKLKLKKPGASFLLLPLTIPNLPIPNLDYGRYHALVIGNNNYRHLGSLKTAVNDARSVASVLTDDYGFKVQLLENATRSDVIRSLSRLRKTVGRDDNLLVYYAGHGYLDEGVNEGYWLPVDADRDDPSNWIQNDTIVAQVRGMQAKHVMVVADSCFSGTITRGLKIEQRTPDWLQKIVKKKARTALTSGGLEPVMDSGGGNHSAFASAFISLLEENDGVLDASQLFSQLRPKVMVNSPQTPEYGNIHQAGHDGGDFLFVRR